MSPVSTVYTDPTLYERQEAERTPWMKLITELVRKYEVKTAIDFGCGLGVDVLKLIDAGLDAYGLDGSEDLKQHVLFHESRYRVGDLTTTLEIPPYDLIWCREVAEHLPAESAPKLIHNIVDNGRVCYFTAAQPGQPGVNHINCQPTNYWLAEFASHGWYMDTYLSAINYLNPHPDDRLNGFVVAVP
jgi:SAM-dependent methyltransferase